MKLEIELPDAGEILKEGCAVPIARKNEKWSSACLGGMQKEKGVYVIHHGGRIMYVGKTDGPTMDIGTRLRREFQETASQNKHIFPKLCALHVPPDIIVHCFPLSVIKQMVKAADRELRSFQLVGIFVTAMIYHLEPEFQQHQVNAMTEQVDKVITKFIGSEPNAARSPAIRSWVRERMK
jgi:hypothetical protein